MQGWEDCRHFVFASDVPWNFTVRWTGFSLGNNSTCSLRNEPPRLLEAEKKFLSEGPQSAAMCLTVTRSQGTPLWSDMSGQHKCATPYSGLQNIVGLREPKFIPDVCPRVPQCCFSRSTATPAQLIRGTHLSLKASPRSHSPTVQAGKFCLTFLSASPILCALQEGSTARGLCSKGFPCSMTSCRELPWLMDSADSFW